MGLLKMQDKFNYFFKGNILGLSKWEEELSFKYQEALNRFQQNPSKLCSNSGKLINLKVKLNHYMTRK